MELEAWHCHDLLVILPIELSVYIDNFMSNSVLIPCGVPQSLILRPLLFLLYINDIVSSSELFKFILFADDTNLFLFNVNLELLLSNVNMELAKVL